jgi:hypothetical protein
MNQVLVGDCTFSDAAIPAAGKSEFGIDTLTRKLSGHRTLLAAFLATLAQGQTYAFNGINFYLQTWEPDENIPTATVSLQYKGLRSPPPVDIQTEFVTAAGSVAASFLLENPDPFNSGIGKGRAYGRREMFRSATIPGFYTADYVVPFAGGYIGYKKVYATGATMEFTYIACQSSYRYVTVGKRGAPAHNVIDINYTPVIKRARIIVSDGTLYGANMATSFDFGRGQPSAPAQLDVVISFTSKNVIGSPYYECIDVVRRELLQPLIV